MHRKTLIALGLITPFVLAKTCNNVTIPVNINARQAIFSQVPVADNFMATEWALNLTSTRNGGNYTDNIVAGYQTVTGTYSISATFCRPDAGIPSDPTVQLLIHGIGFDRTYWDLPVYNGANSYVNTAVNRHNFCTLAIDRFGIASSYTPGLDPINLVQAPATMSTILSITQHLRAGTIPTVPTRFSKVVHVGHSFGAFLSYFLVTLYPTASDGLILTGFSFDATWFKRTIAGFNPHLARLNQPLRFGAARLGTQPSFFGSSPRPGATSTGPWTMGTAYTDIVSYILNLIRIQFPTSSGFIYDSVYADVATTEVLDLINGYNDTTITPQNLPNSYLSWSDITANIYAFLYPPAIDVDTALYAEKTKQPTTIGELLTIGNAAASAPGFQGPVLIITGRQDNIYCGGDCTTGLSGVAVGGGVGGGAVGPNIIQAGATAFPNATVFEAYIQPEMGHGMNFHRNATGYYEVVQGFLEASGLGSG